MSRNRFYIIIVALAIFSYLATSFVDNQYYFFAGFAILQLLVMALAWNILGGYAGYVNFGSAAFFGLGAYAAIVVLQLFDATLITQIIVGGCFAGIVGLATGYLTLRLRGVYFAIATLALLVVAETLIVNWDYVGGAAGAILGRLRSTRSAGHGLRGAEEFLRHHAFERRLLRADLVFLRLHVAHDVGVLLRLLLPACRPRRHYRHP